MSRQAMSLIVALGLACTASTQASESVTQEENRVNKFHTANKTDIEDYDTLHYIGLGKARQQLRVFQEKSKRIYDKYIYKKNIPYGLSSRESF